jgi:hypothetical protein
MRDAAAQVALIAADRTLKTWDIVQVDLPVLSRELDELLGE